MPCLSSYTLRGVSYDCRANLAGVKRLYLTYWENVIPEVDETAHTITGYTLTDGAEWYRYDFAKNTASLTSTLNKDEAAGIRYYTHTISASFNKLDRANHIEFMALAGERLAAVVVSNDGTKWYLGLDGYVGSASQEAGTGVGSDDRNGYSLQLDCTSAWLPFRFTADIDDPEPGPTPPQPTVKYVQDLIDEGYARVVTGAGGTYIEILSGTPYTASQIVDLGEVARNEKKLTGTTNNVIVWDQPLPSGWSNSDLTSIYAGKSLNFTPRARLLWALGDVNSFEITFAGGSYNVNDYPWGSGANNNGVFAPRFNSASGPDYFWKTPKNLTVNFTGSYGSIAQTMFAEMHSTTALTINVLNGGFFSVVDWTGMYEDCYNLETLTINGMFRYDFTRLCHNMFKNCEKLQSVPYFVSWGRDHTQNTVRPHTQPGGSADAGGMFAGCNALTSIGLTLDFDCISLSGCTVDGSTQAPLSAKMIECPNLTDVRIKNLGHNSWNFADPDGKVYAPKMDVASIEYILNNVQDETGNGYTLTFSTLHQGDISSTAISNATSKGWTIAYA